MKAPKRSIVPARPERTEVARPEVPGPSPEAFAENVREIIGALGEDPDREGLVKTPDRVEKSLRFLTQGYWMTVEEVVGDAVFEETHQSMIMVRDIELYSLCEHHLLPFFGRAHVAYIPNGKILGLSKVARIVDVFARRLQVQERLTDEIADAIMDVLHPTGVGVVITAAHFCMMMRGVEKQHSGAVTSAMLGAFRTNRETRDEFLSLVAHSAVQF
jgi:GTP cyclohydrolase IA